jgi:putative peptidoglycan lipid II flippase
LLLMVPAMVGLIVLRVDLVTMLFQHGACGHACTVRNALALQNYAYQLPFLALDQLLIAAFYARKNTLTPVLVGVVAIVFWLVVAVPFASSIGMPAIAFANTALNSGHAVILFVLLTLAIGSLGLPELLGGAARIALAALAMGALCAVVATLLPHLWPGVFALTRFRGQVLTVLVAGGLGVLLYFELAARLGVEEVRLLRGMLRAKLGRS